MQLEARKYLFDMQQAADLIARFTERRTVEDYAGLFEQSGLRLARTIPTGHPAMTVVEAVASPRA